MPDYEITALPEGYRLVYSFENDRFVEKRYEDSTGHTISFLYMINKSNYTVFDTENNKTKVCNIGDINCEYIIEDEFAHFAWESSNYVFSLKARDFDTAKALICSVELKK